MIFVSSIIFQSTYHSPIPMLGSSTKQDLCYSSPSEFASPIHFHTHSTVIHPLMLSATKSTARDSTNQVASLMSHDIAVPSEKTTPSGGLFKAPPPKSAIPLRRSARLSKESGRRLSEHAIHVSSVSLISQDTFVGYGG